MSQWFMFTAVIVLALSLTECGGSDPTGPTVITQCQDQRNISVACAPDTGPSATATSNGAPATTAP